MITFSTLTISDTRGVGAGWTTTLSCSDLRGRDTSLPFTSFTAMSGSPHASVHTSTPVSDLIIGSGGMLFGTDTTPGISQSDPIALLTAPAGSGLGSYAITPAITIPIPARADPKSYAVACDFSLL